MFNKLKNSCISGVKCLATGFLSYLPMAVLGIILCFSVKAIFGAEYIMVALVSLLSIKGLFKTTPDTANYMRHTVYLLFIVLMGTLASLNILAGLFINLILIFAFAFIFCDNFKEGKLFMFCLQLLLMQYPGHITANMVLPRILSCLLCIAVGGVFLTLFNNMFRKRKDNQYVLNACDEIALKLRGLLDENAKGKLDLFNLTTSFCKQEYEKLLNQDYLLDEATKTDFLALMTFEQMSDLIYDTPAKLGKLTEQDIEYFEELIKYFSKIKTLKRLSINLSNFVDEYSLSNPQLSSLWKKYILTLAGFLKYRGKPVTKTSVKEAIAFRYSVLKKRFTITSLNFRNAVQMSVLVSVCTAIAQLISVSDIILCPIALMAILAMQHDKRLKFTFIGFAGIIAVAGIYMVSLRAVPFELRVTVSIIATIILLATVKNIFAVIAFSTQLLSCVYFQPAAISPEAMLKVMYLVFACLFGLVLTEFVFATPKSQRYKLHTIDLAQFDWSAMHQLENSRLDDPRKSYLCEIMFIQHLMVEHISNSSTAKVESNKIRYSGMLSFNCDLLSEIAYALTILRPSKLPKDWVLAMKKRLTNIF